MAPTLYRKTLSILLLLLTHLTIADAQRDVEFGYVGIKDGLSNSQINVIRRDSRGYVWIGTQSGLNRYDGYRFRTFFYKSTDKSSLPNNWISDIQEASNHRLLIRTPMGYTIFDTDTERFDSDNSIWMNNRHLKGTMDVVHVDRHMNWAVASNGVGLYYAIRNGGTYLFAFGKHLPEGTITDIAEYGRSLILTYNTGRLVCIIPSERRVAWVSDYIPNHRTRQTDEDYHTYVSRFCNFWVTANEQTWIYNQRQKRWFSSVDEYLKAENYTDVPSGTLYAKGITEDQDGRLWMGTEHRGLIRINYSDKSVCQYEYNPNNQLSVADNTIQSLYLDQTGALWVGTYKNGLSYYSPNAARFNTIPLGDVCTIVEDGNGCYWCGTNDAGIVVYNPKTGEQRQYHMSETGLGSEVVVSSTRLADGSLWFGTFNGGLACYSQGQWTSFRAGTSPLANDNVWALAALPDGRLAIGTLGSGLQLLEPATRTFETLNTRNSNLSSDYLNSLDVTHGGDILTGHSNNYSILDLRTRKWDNYDPKETGLQFPSPAVNQAYEDSRGLVWAATASGCAVYDPRTRQMTVLNWTAGTTGSVACSVVEDHSGCVWLVSDHGASRIKVQKGEEGWEFYTESFNEYDGLQKRQFNFRSILCARNGDVILGGQDGINIIPPQKLIYKENHDVVLFSGLRIFDHEVNVGETYNGRVVLEGSMNSCRHLDLQPGENAFTILLATNKVDIPATSRFSYRLRGFNDKWQITPQNDPSITFTNLSPGDYTLEVRAVVRNGSVSDRVSTLELHVNPPFYRTWWAYTVYLLLAIALAWLARHIMLRRQLERIRQERIRQEAEHNRQIDEMKLTFFTNVSHELRTPLTLIVSPLDKMMKAETDPQKRERLSLVHRNALRLFELVNQLLDFRKMDQKKQVLELTTGNVVAFVRDIVKSFQVLSARRVALSFHSELESLSMSFDADKLRKVVDNLLSNAYKYTPDGGRVTVSLSVKPKDLHDEDTLYIKVADTGEGVPDQDKPHIFEPFYQASNHVSNPYGGSGVGLSLVSDFVKMHEGTVTVHDAEGGGSEFVVAIPIRHDASLSHLTSPEQLASISDTKEPFYEPKESSPDSEESGSEDTLAETQDLSVDTLSETQDSPTNDSTKEQGPSKPKGRRADLLLVDDADDFLTFMTEVLSDRYKVRTARDGVEALERVKERKPDIILSDVMMPRMDGRELCQRLKADSQTANIPFIMLTARMADTQKVEGMTLGADDYLTKPFNMDILFLRIDNLLKWRAAASDKKPVIEPTLQDLEVSSADEEFVQAATDYVEANLSNCDTSVETMAAAMSVSRAQLYRRVLSLTGSTPSEFIRSIRLRHAEQLLRESQLSVSEVAYRVGFSNPRYFSKYFAEAYGCNPSQYGKEK